MFLYTIIAQNAQKEKVFLKIYASFSKFFSLLAQGIPVFLHHPHRLQMVWEKFGNPLQFAACF